MKKKKKRRKHFNENNDIYLLMEQSDRNKVVSRNEIMKVLTDNKN